MRHKFLKSLRIPYDTFEIVQQSSSNIMILQNVLTLLTKRYNNSHLTNIRRSHFIAMYETQQTQETKH